MRKLIGPLVDFNCWANRRLLGTVEALPADAFTREPATDSIVYYLSAEG